MKNIRKSVCLIMTLSMLIFTAGCSGQQASAGAENIQDTIQDTSGTETAAGGQETEPDESEAETAAGGQETDTEETAPEEDAAQDTASQETDREENEADRNESDESGNQESGDIVIIYTNDVHSYIDNKATDDDDNVTGDGLRFSKIAAYVNDLRDEGGNVLLVDAGDEIQGAIYGAMDDGETVIRLMNAAGYQLATLGNHEFDYGMITMLRRVGEADYPYVSCNFRNAGEAGDDLVLDASQILETGGKKVAFVGITTPQSFTSSTPVYFQNEKGEFIYGIDGAEDPADLYESVQKAIDDVRDEADYVIALGHTGVGQDAQDEKISSLDVIANVSGLDAYIDGHSHTVMEGENVKDKDGRDVLLTQTGCYLASFGKMTIGEDGSITSELIDDYDREDEKVAELERSWIKSVNDEMGEKIAELDNKLYTTNPNNKKMRLIRTQELNLGDFAADAIYWFLNEKMGMDCDIAVMNGGGIRADAEKGDVTFLTARQVETFGNMVCLISATGQQIIDMLEMGAKETGKWDNDADGPAENGGFIQAAGLTYTIDASIESSVKTDGKGMFQSVEGDYRVKDVKVYNKETGSYEPIDPDGVYTLGGRDYMLLDGGCGESMFEGDDVILNYAGEDYIVLAEYMQSFASTGGYPEINNENSPLSTYDGYLLDYENPYGAGRINIINDPNEGKY